jgi:hypothetical protein
MFKPTHQYYFANNSNNFKTWPKGIPVLKGETDEDGLSSWIADEYGNIAGWAYENDGHVKEIK